MNLKALSPFLHHQLIRALGRDRLDYLCSNTMNLVTSTLAPFLWGFDLKAIVLQRRVDTRNVVSFELLPNQYWQTPKAGQSIELEITLDGQTLERAYSISAVENHSFWITVKRLKQGKVSTALHEQLQVGDTVKLRGPFGAFTYQQQKSLLFVFAGSGITPCFAMIQELLALPENQRPDIQVYGQFSRPEDTIFADTLKTWRTQSVQNTHIKGLKIDLAYSQKPEAGTCMPLKPKQLMDFCPDLAQRHVYLCGPEGFMAGFMAEFQELNLPPEQVHIEHFSPQITDLPEDATKTNLELSEIYFSAYHYRLQMKPEDQGKSLLTLGLEHGLNLEKGCQKGYCGSCKLVLHQGEVQGLTHGRAVYICSAYAKSKQIVLGY